MLFLFFYSYNCNMQYLFIITFLFKIRIEKKIDAFLVLWLHFRGKLFLQDHSHLSTSVNKSWPKTKNTGQCGRYMARYWK